MPVTFKVSSLESPLKYSIVARTLSLDVLTVSSLLTLLGAPSKETVKLVLAVLFSSSSKTSPLSATESGSTILRSLYGSPHAVKILDKASININAIAIGLFTIFFKRFIFPP